jgi:hypothetical protein
VGVASLLILITAATRFDIPHVRATDPIASSLARESTQFGACGS